LSQTYTSRQLDAPPEPTIGGGSLIDGIGHGTEGQIGAISVVLVHPATILPSAHLHAHPASAELDCTSSTAKPKQIAMNLDTTTLA